MFLEQDNKMDILFLKESPPNSYQKYIFDFESSFERDEPYIYHSKLIEVLAFTTIGKEGLALSESKLRGTLGLRYIFELLCQDDTLHWIGENEEEVSLEENELLEEEE